MEPPLLHASVAAARDAIEANLRRFALELAGGWRQAEVDERPGIARFATPLAHPSTNGVVLSAFGADDVDERIDECIDWFALRQRPLTWWVGPSASPADLAERLTARGLPASGRLVGMAAVLDNLPEPRPVPATVVPVGAEVPVDWLEFAAECFAMPPDAGRAWRTLMATQADSPDQPLRHWLAWRNGRLVSCATLFLAAGVAGIYNVGTRPTARRQGLAGRLVGDALRYARERGYRTAVLHATDMGRGVYERLGFGELCQLHQHVAELPPERR